MTPARTIPHGSPKGYELGCRSRGGCPYHRDSSTLTCVEATIAARGDRALAALPTDQPLPRLSAGVTPNHTTDEKQRPATTHGTVWRYRQGCTDSHRCPHWRLGRMTCAEARRRYFAEYHERRRSGDGTPIEHGTSAGYLSGCTSADACPRGQQGRSCHEARAEYRRRRARNRGIKAPAPTVPAQRAARLVTELAETPLTVREISRVAGVGRSTIARLLSVHGKDLTDGLRIREATHAAICVAHAERMQRPVLACPTGE